MEELKGYFLQQGPVVFLMALFVYGLVDKKWWVTATQHEDLRAMYEQRLVEAYRDRDEWKGIAKRVTGFADRAVGMAAQK